MANAKNYNFLMKTNLSPYIGEWVAICGERIVSHGPHVKKVYAEAKKKCPKERPLLTKVHEKQTMIF
ncbi:hypothetical protein D6774_01880 [Candidatus Woesearchaeota archaeon]|nr:MAG: hypothetical protein D6774_01880 [Candidatus Woesearchaeota archaeon]